MPSYRINAEAEEDLIRIYQYGIQRFGERQADLYLDFLYESFDLIVRQPYTYPSVDFIRQGYRRCICGPESIFFKISGELIDIMAIVGRQHLPTKLKY